MSGRRDLNTTNSSWRTSSRSPSPPPPPPQIPPPPLESSFIVNVNAGYASIPERVDKSASNRGNSNSKQQDVKSFPFLRKKSRKEPSALHRINSDNSKSKSPSAIAASSSNNNNNSTPSKVFSGLTKAASKASTQGKDDVLLQGSDYWGLDQSILEDMRPTNTNYAAEKHQEDASLFSPLQQTNVSMAVEDLERRRSESVQNLEEFRRIEEEVLNDERSGTRNLKRMLSRDVEQSAPVTHSDSWGAVTRPSNKQQDGPPFQHTASRHHQQQHLIPQYDSDDYDNGPSVPRTASYDNNHAASAAKHNNHNHHNNNTSNSTPNRRAHSAGPPMNRTSAVVNSNDTTDDNDDSHSKVSGRIIRPASTLKVNNVTPTNGRSNTPTNRRNGANHSNNKIPSNKATEHYNSQRETEDKIRALESEVETFKSENQNLKKLKRQQEQTLAEVLQKKDEMMRYCDEEKQRTVAWCEEQKQTIEKERRTVAKQLRDARQRALTSTTPIRKEKAEMEALQATIEKMKMTHETAIKKWKARESSLHSLVSEQSEHIENMEKQLFSLEETRIGLLEFITVNGLRPPKALLSRGAASTGNNKSKSSSQTTPVLSAPKKDTHRGYMEEVEFQLVPTHTTTYQASFDPLTGGSEEVKRSKSAPSAPTTRMRREKNSAPQFVDDNDYPRVVESLDSLLDDFAPIKQTKEPFTTARYHSAKAVLAISAEPKQLASKEIPSAETGGKTLKRSTSRGSFRSKDQLSLSPKTMKSVSSSWARSSRSSGRYSNGSSSQQDQGAHEEDYDDHREERHVAFTAADAALRFFDDDQDNLVSTHKSDLTETFKFATPGMGANVNKIPQQQAQQQSSSSMTRATTTTEGIAAMDQPEKSNNANRTEETRPDGSRFIRYRNGTTKDIDAKGNILIRFSNQDTKFTDVTTGSIVYYYSENQTTHTTFVDGLELFEFPNGQMEKHFPSGKKEVTFPDRSKKTIYENGMQESVYPDGVVLREYADGRKEVLNK